MVHYQLSMLLWELVVEVEQPLLVAAVVVVLEPW